MDKDFGELVFRSQHPHRGVLLLRLEEQAPARASRSFQKFLSVTRRGSKELRGVPERAPENFAKVARGHDCCPTWRRNTRAATASLPIALFSSLSRCLDPALHLHALRNRACCSECAWRPDKPNPSPKPVCQTSAPGVLSISKRPAVAPQLARGSYFSRDPDAPGGSTRRQPGTDGKRTAGFAATAPTARRRAWSRCTRSPRPIRQERPLPIRARVRPEQANSVPNETLRELP